MMRTNSFVRIETDAYEIEIREENGEVVWQAFDLVEKTIDSSSAISVNNAFFAAVDSLKLYDISNPIKFPLGWFDNMFCDY